MGDLHRRRRRRFRERDHPDQRRRHRRGRRDEVGDFPTKNTSRTSYQGLQDAFALRLGADGDVLRWSQYLGGNKADAASDIALGAADSVVVGGFTSSSDMPTGGGGISQSYEGGSQDGFLLDLRADGSLATAATSVGAAATRSARSRSTTAASTPRAPPTPPTSPRPVARSRVSRPAPSTTTTASSLASTRGPLVRGRTSAVPAASRSPTWPSTTPATPTSPVARIPTPPRDHRGLSGRAGRPQPVRRVRREVPDADHGRRVGDVPRGVQLRRGQRRQLHGVRAVDDEVGESKHPAILPRGGSSVSRTKADSGMVGCSDPCVRLGGGISTEHRSRDGSRVCCHRCLEAAKRLECRQPYPEAIPSVVVVALDASCDE